LPRSARVAFAVRLHSRKYRWLHAPATNLDPGASPPDPYTVRNSRWTQGDHPARTCGPPDFSSLSWIPKHPDERELASDDRH
jgi:hypothetical protein